MRSDSWSEVPADAMHQQFSKKWDGYGQSLVGSDDFRTWPLPGSRPGFTPEQMIGLLDAGREVETLLDLIRWRRRLSQTACCVDIPCLLALTPATFVPVNWR
jgi:hypothetical protein